MAAKKMTFEQAMARLNEIVKALESGDGSLEQSMKLFEEGSKLAETCSAMLDDAEQKVTKLIAADSDQEVPFEAED
jgi:exodeoxyribonuclease VII small subunit